MPIPTSMKKKVRGYFHHHNLISSIIHKPHQFLDSPVTCLLCRAAMFSPSTSRSKSMIMLLESELDSKPIIIHSECIIIHNTDNHADIVLKWVPGGLGPKGSCPLCLVGNQALPATYWLVFNSWWALPAYVLGFNLHNWPPVASSVLKSVCKQRPSEIKLKLR